MHSFGLQIPFVLNDTRDWVCLCFDRFYSGPLMNYSEIRGFVIPFAIGFLCSANQSNRLITWCSLLPQTNCYLPARNVLFSFRKFKFWPGINFLASLLVWISDQEWSEIACGGKLFPTAKWVLIEANFSPKQANRGAWVWAFISDSPLNWIGEIWPNGLFWFPSRMHVVCY